MLLERIEALIDESIEEDAPLIGLRRIRDYFDLDRDLNGQIANPAILANWIKVHKYTDVFTPGPRFK